ncbi:MAG: thiamine phosphate synthase [Arenimonas sp.]|nr:thiamine phosphate synthase [Arenimonas sp.]MBP7981470.1 thiamine phosphate synthase [Arenimonas sp.]
MKARLKNTGGIYLITPDMADTARLCMQVESLLRQPVALLQYRNKAADAPMRRKQAKALQTLARQAEVPFIINDDWQLAMDIDADGVHLGAEDALPGLVRTQAGGRMIIGVSCYNDLPRARRMSFEDVDYLAFGAAFPSQTKPGAPQVGLDILRAAKAFGKPLVAIGGISPDNSDEVWAAGADYVAVVSGIFSAADPQQALASYMNTFQRHYP